MTERKWGNVTITFLEANGRLTQTSNLICTVSPSRVMAFLNPKMLVY